MYLFGFLTFYENENFLLNSTYYFDNQNNSSRNNKILQMSVPERGDKEIEQSLWGNLKEGCRQGW